MPAKKTDLKPVFSVVAPVFNEIGCVEEFYKTVSSVMQLLKQPWELVLVDDGSTDGSTDKIQELSFGDPLVKPIIFARNFGHQIAVTAGLDYARGDAVIIIDADLQDPPAVMLDLI
ncbi:MAG: glycosyltransferase, partial [Anaerolineaceae bacterium]|nr:glycosyltransferase [Anaerolineaceae bacterium]